MKICIFGAGAIGGLMGVQLARAGADVSFIARGPHLAAMREHGARLVMDGETFSAPVRCTSDPSELGVQDFVIVTLKAHSLPGVVDSMQPLLGKHTAIVTGVNGIPYWYFYQHGGRFAGTRLASVDPDGSQWTKLGPERAIGCVLYPAAEIVEPGVIKTDFLGRSMEALHDETLTEYTEYSHKVTRNIFSNGASGSSPHGVAGTIYRAATDSSKKLRYPTGKSKELILLRKMLPLHTFATLMTRAIENA